MNALKLTAGLVSLSVLVGCANSPICSPAADGGSRINVTTSFVEGHDLAAGSPPPATPYKVAALVISDGLLNEVKLGGVLAQPRSGFPTIWEASLQRSELERNRDGGVATLSIEAVDLCGVVHTSESLAVIPIGPAAGVAVQNLAVTVELSPTNECSLPGNNTVNPLVRVTASADSAGGTVRLDTNNGTFSGGEKTKSLLLGAVDGRAEASTYFFPAMGAGFATISASAAGASAVPRVIPVVGPPEMSTSATRLERGQPYFASVRTFGNLDTCSAEESSPDTATIEIVDPPMGPIVGSTSVLRAPVACDSTEQLRVKVQFASTAIDGGAIVLRCSDTFHQESSVTFSLAQ